MRVEVTLLERARVGHRSETDEELAFSLFHGLPWPYPTSNVTTLKRWALRQDPPLTYLDALHLMESKAIKVDAMRWRGPKGGKRRVWAITLDPQLVERLGLRPALLMAGWRRPQP